jgi:hypothetical protein
MVQKKYMREREREREGGREGRIITTSILVKSEKPWSC